MTITQDELKEQVAQAAVDFILPKLSQKMILGIGTGSTVDRFIDLLAKHQGRFAGAVSSSERSTERLLKYGLTVYDLNEVDALEWYIDGADEITADRAMTKGGGGALTREKIVASVAKQFLCIVDESKQVKQLGAFALPIEVLPLAQRSVTRHLQRFGGQVQLRPDFVTDNGGVILDVHGLSITDPQSLEREINDIPGVVCCGLFALQPATVALVAGQKGVITLS